MSIIKKILLILPIILIGTQSQLSAEEVKKIGKYKDWESMVVTEATGKVCFAQSSPILQAPKSFAIIYINAPRAYILRSASLKHGRG